jgi:chromosomal replication initiator protein
VDNIAYLLDENSSPWARAMALVREECSEFGAAFFDAVGFDGFCEGYVCLTVPDSFRETWLNSHYGALLRKTNCRLKTKNNIDNLRYKTI